MVSMKDIAAACGVSVATVSKALNNHSDIGEETRELVKRTAKEMGYHPNYSARALKTRKSYNLGVLYKENSGSGLTHDYFAQVLENFKVTAENRGYDITFLNNSRLRKDSMSYLEHSIYRGMDGVMITIVDYKDPQVIELLQSDLPVVTVDYMFNGRISVMSDNVDGIQALLQYIYQKGHRKIAYVHGEDSSVTTNRLSTYYRFLEEKGIEVPESYVREGKYRDSYTAGILTNELLALKEPPTCIIYPDDFSAIGGMNMVKNKGMKVPQDISIAGYDGILLASQIDPVLTTYWQNTVDIGKNAAEKLINLIEKPRSTVLEPYMARGHMIEGQSVADIN